MSSEPPFAVGAWVVAPFAPSTRFKVLEVKPYQGVPCGWLARLENYALPWVDMSPLTLATLAQKPPAPRQAPATRLDAPAPHPAPKAAKPAPTLPPDVNPSLF